MSFKFITPQNNVLLTTHPNLKKKKTDTYVKLGFEIVRKLAVVSV